MSLLLTIQAISKSYAGKPVLSGVDAVIAPGWRIGVTGRNGAGKSTLARIITGTETADSGTVTPDPSLRLAHLEQHAEFRTGETLLAHLMRVSGKPEWECARMASRFGFGNDEFSRPAAQLSGGRATRLRLAAALLGDPNLLVLDEPTNCLDLPTQMLLEAYLFNYRGALLVISHDREFLRRNCDRTWEVESGRVAAWNGPIDGYLREKAQRRETAESSNRNIDAKRGQLERFVERFRAKASKSTQAKSKMKMLERLKKERSAIDALPPEVRIHLPKVTVRRGEALHTHKLAVGYPDRVVAQDITISLPRGRRMAILGENGAGKSTFLKTVAGALPQMDGAFRWYSGADIGYLPQLIDAERSKETVLDFLRRVAAPRTTTEQIMRVAGNFLFAVRDHDKHLDVLSGGERSRLHLAALTLGSYDVLLLDEPTTHLDADTADSLAAALMEYRGSVVFVSHDREFTARVATDMALVEGDRMIKYPGTYDEYIDGLEAAAAMMNPQAPRATPEHGTEIVKNDARSLRRQMKKLDGRIETLKREQEELFKHFAEDPTDPDPAPRKRLTVLVKEIAAAEDEWLAVAWEADRDNRKKSEQEKS